MDIASYLSLFPCRARVIDWLINNVCLGSVTNRPHFFIVRFEVKSKFRIFVTSSDQHSDPDHVWPSYWIWIFKLSFTNSLHGSLPPKNWNVRCQVQKDTGNYHTVKWSKFRIDFILDPFIPMISSMGKNVWHSVQSDSWVSSTMNNFIEFTRTYPFSVYSNAFDMTCNIFILFKKHRR